MAKNEKMLADLWFLQYYYDILDYTNVSYRSVYSYEEEYVQNMKGQTQNKISHIQVHVTRKKKGLRVDKMQPISK